MYITRCDACAHMRECIQTSSSLSRSRLLQGGEKGKHQRAHERAPCKSCFSGSTSNVSYVLTLFVGRVTCGSTHTNTHTHSFSLTILDIIATQQNGTIHTHTQKHTYIHNTRIDEAVYTHARTHAQTHTHAHTHRILRCIDMAVFLSIIFRNTEQFSCLAQSLCNLK